MNFAYLSCPYGHEDPAVREQRYLAAVKVVGMLMQQRKPIYSPIVHNHTVALACNLPRDWSFWCIIDLPMLHHAAELIVLTLLGWEISVGVGAEISVSKHLGIPITYMDPLP